MAAPPGCTPFWQRQAKQFAALARFLPTTDVFHFYFGLTLALEGGSSRR